MRLPRVRARGTAAAALTALCLAPAPAAAAPPPSDPLPAGLADTTFRCVQRLTNYGPVGKPTVVVVRRGRFGVHVDGPHFDYAGSGAKGYRGALAGAVAYEAATRTIRFVDRSLFEDRWHVVATFEPDGIAMPLDPRARRRFQLVLHATDRRDRPMEPGRLDDPYAYFSPWYCAAVADG